MCLSVPRRIPTLLHGPGCNLGNGRGCPLVVKLLGGFAIGARVSLLRQHSAERQMSASACARSMPGFQLVLESRLRRCLVGPPEFGGWLF